MKKLLLSLLLISACIGMQAQDNRSAKPQSASYTHHVLAADGCGVVLDLIMSDNQPTILVKTKSDNMTFDDDPTFLIRTFDDQVIQLKGSKMDVTSSTGMVLIQNVAVPLTDIIATAKFPITEEQINLLKAGVKKVRLSLIPLGHEHIFKRDKIGLTLYNEYQRLKHQSNDF